MLAIVRCPHFFYYYSLKKWNARDFEILNLEWKLYPDLNLNSHGHMIWVTHGEQDDPIWLTAEKWF